LKNGAKSIMFLGGEPTVHVPELLRLIAELPDNATLILKTNACVSDMTRKYLDGLFDVWLADYKFGNGKCAGQLAALKPGFDYAGTVQSNLEWAADRSDLIIRHQLMPGHVECCWRPVAEWISRHLPDVKVSLRDAYWPLSGSATNPELTRLVSDEERKLACSIVNDYRLNLVS
jgi:putative pyruvate formate lyase activating enzyme